MSRDTLTAAERLTRFTPPATAAHGSVLHITTIPMSLVFLRGQVGYMRRQGLRIAALSSPGPELTAFGEREDVPVRAVPMTRDITPLRDLGSLWSICRVIRALRPDIVHAHTPKGGLLGMLAASLMGVRSRVYHMRGLPLVTARGVRRWLLRATERVACALAHQVLCVSNSLRDVAIAERLCDPDKLRVLKGGSGNGVDASGRFDPALLPPAAREETRGRVGIPADAVVIGFVGRLVRDKGIIELAQAWQSVRERFPAAHLLLVGPFEPQDPVPPGVRHALERDPRVHLAGEDWNTPPLYAAMDLVAMPTYREGFPNVPLEAAAMELPMVATRIPGCVDAIADGVTGTLVPPRDVERLAGAIGVYLEDAELRRRHGLAGRARVLREFRQEAIWESLYIEYSRFLSSREDSRPSPEPDPVSAGAA